MTSRSISLSDGGPFWGKVSTGTLWGRLAAGAIVGTFACGAQAAPVTISGISSSEPNLFTGASLNEAGDRITVEFASFAASAPVSMGPISQPFASAFDTISFRLTAAEGWFFSTLDYREEVTATASNGGFAFATGSFTFNGTSVPLGTVMALSTIGTATTNGSLYTSPTVQLGPQFTTLDITITNSLFAGALGANASATIAKTSALLNIQTQFIPVPAAAWLFASAMVGLVTIGRRGSFA